MRASFKVIFAVLALAGFVSCSGGPDQLSKKEIKGLLSEKIEQEWAHQRYSEVTTGYYEENDADERYELRKLAAAGVITYKMEKFKVKETVREYYWWSYEDKVVTKTHYFVETALTDLGRKLSVDEIPVYSPKDKYLEEPEDRSYPEDTVSRQEEKMPKEESGVDKTQSNVSAKGSQDQVKDAPKKQKTDYEKAQEREYEEEYIVKSCRFKVMDVRDIILKDGTATASAVVDIVDVTPFGRILSRLAEGSHLMVSVDLVYYQDKGWQISDFDLNY